MNNSETLSRREREILDILYLKGSATAAEVREAMADAPSYSAVRALLRILEEKGHATHQTEGTRYVYGPSVPRERARNSALRSEEHTSELQSQSNLVCRLLLEKKKKNKTRSNSHQTKRRYMSR